MYKVLIIEDDLATSTFLKRIIARYKNYQIKYASNGLEAMKILEKEKLDGVISDIQMPIVSGFEVLEFIRGNPKLETMPVMMMSALNSRDEIEKALNLKIYDYMLKPLNLNETILRIERFFDFIEKYSQKRIESESGEIQKSLVIISVNEDKWKDVIEKITGRYHVIFYKSAIAGLEYCLNSFVDIVVLDKELGGTDQHLTAKLIKKSSNEISSEQSKSNLYLIGLDTENTEHFDNIISSPENLLEKI